MKRISKYLIFPAVLILGLAQFAPASAGDNDQDKVFVAELSGASEVPKRNTDAKGMVKLRFPKNENRAEFVVEVEGIRDVKAAHLHLG